VQPRRVKVDTLLQGYRLDTNRGAVAFCSVKLLEVPDETGVVRRPVVDTGHTGRAGRSRSNWPSVGCRART